MHAQESGIDGGGYMTTVGKEVGGSHCHSICKIQLCLCAQRSLSKQTSIALRLPNTRTRTACVRQGWRINRKCSKKGGNPPFFTCSTWHGLSSTGNFWLFSALLLLSFSLPYHLVVSYFPKAGVRARGHEACMKEETHGV